MNLTEQEQKQKLYPTDKLIKEYIKFRNLIFKDQLNLLKHELVNILFLIYKRIFKQIFRIFTKIQPNEEIKEKYIIFFAVKKPDFNFNLKYVKEIEYIENVFKKDFNFETIK